MSQEYETHGYSGDQRNPSQRYPAPGHSSQGYSPTGDFAAGFPRPYTESSGRLAQDYGAPGGAALPYGAREYGDPSRGTAEYSAPEYSRPAPGVTEPGAPDYGHPARGGQAPGVPDYGHMARGGQAPGVPDYGHPARGQAPGVPDYSSAPRRAAEYYSAPAGDRGEYGAPDLTAEARDPGEYRVREYGVPSRGATEHGAPDYSAPARGAAQYRSPEYSGPAPGTAAYRFQEYRDPSRGGQQDRPQHYGAPGSGPQGYPARSHQDPVSAPHAQRQPQGYAASAYAAPAYAASAYAAPAYAAPAYDAPGQASLLGHAGPDPAAGRSMHDSGPSGLTGIAAPGAAASWDAAATVAGPPTAAMAPGATVSAGAPAPMVEPSAEPLYRVLGGLALRDLTLVESLLELVEQLESREEDPQQLDSLFRVDHLATRMRRNSENLLVLAGQDRESQDFDPVQLLDVARAAVSEIADYDRAQVAPLPSVQVLGVAADDVTHILAELLDNAMSKSPESAEVVIRAERTGDGTLVVSVEDSGIGLPIDRLNEINARLSRSPVVDVAVTRHMGLYVVGRLAHRHGIRVQLRERPYGGLVASVIIPSQLVRSDPDAPREIMPAETAGRLTSLGGAGLSTPQLSIEARGADGLRAQRQGALQSGIGTSGFREAAGPRVMPGAAGRAAPGARSGTGWPVSARQEADLERPSPAPAAGYPDAVPVPRFEPADPAELPKRKPGALSAANGIPAPLERGDKVPVSAADEPAVESEAERIRDELSEFQLGQRAARSEVPGPASAGSVDQQDGSSVGTDTGEPPGGAPAEAGDNDGA